MICSIEKDKGVLYPLVDIRDSDDIVLTEVRADLNLDQLQRYLARIGHAVETADRQIDRFRFVHDDGLVVACHLGGAADHDPMFGAVIVLL